MKIKLNELYVLDFVLPYFSFHCCDWKTFISLGNVWIEIERDNYWKAKYDEDDEHLRMTVSVEKKFVFSVYWFYGFSLPYFSFERLN